MQNPDILAHIQECEACKQLYDMDTCLESCIQQSFAMQKLPPGLARKINQHINTDFFSKTDPFPQTMSAHTPVNGQSPNK